jgi:hypothetical protein
MEQLAKAALLVQWASKAPELIEVQYNPTELSYDKGVQLAEIPIPGLDAPLQQFVRGQAEKLTVELFFDTTEQGMGKRATSVTTLTDKIYQLIKIEPKRHAPPICTFVWSEQFPGSSIGGTAGKATNAIGSAVGAAVGALVGGAAGAVGELVGRAVGAVVGAVAGAANGNQRRNGFKCIVESVRQQFTLFSPEGVPLRATLTVTLREYKTLEDQLAQLNLNSPDRTHSHVVQRGETLAAIAAQYYERPGEWRAIAAANEIEDPRRLNAGTFLTIPPIR